MGAGAGLSAGKTRPEHFCADERRYLGHRVYSSKEQSQSERVVFAINDQIDDHCPKCINDTVYVEKLISLPIEQGEFYLCRCGKCGWRFPVNAAEVCRSTNARRRGDRIITL